MKIKIENISIANLLKSGIYKKIFDDLTFELDFSESQLISIFSSEETGKSTLLKIIAGLQKAEEGKIIVNEKDTEVSSVKVVYIPSQPVSLPWMNVKQNLEFGLHKHELSEERTNFIIRLIGLEGYEEHIPDKYSLGFRFRIALGRSLYSDPDFILLDEPFKNLDVLTKEEIFLMMKKILNETKVKFLLATGIFSDALFLSDEIIIIDRDPSKRIEKIRVEKKFLSLQDLLHSDYLVNIFSNIQMNVNPAGFQF